MKAYNKYSGEGTITTTGYEELFNQWYMRHYEDGNIKMDNHFAEGSYSGKGKNAKMRCSADIVTDFGGVFALS